MICRKCGTECPDGNIFCEACGAELDAPVLPENIDDRGRVKKQKMKKQKNEKPRKEKRQRSPEEKAAFQRKLRGAGICLAAIAVIALVVWIVNIAGAGKGFSYAQSIPLGRNMEYAASETGLVFEEVSSNALINSMAVFDYVCLSEDTVKVNGSEQPRWAIMITVSEDNIITDVEYYDFSQLKINWKGRKSADILTSESLDFGTSIKNVSKTLGMSPYYVKRSVSNDSTYCYRYYYTDETAGFDHVYNFYVDFSDVEMTVRNVHYKEINYAAAILNASEQPVPYGISGISEEDGEETDEEDSDDTSDSDDDYSDE